MSYNNANKRRYSLEKKKEALLDGVCFILSPLFLVIWQTLPAEGEAPVKVAPVVVLPIRGRLHELKGVEINGGYVGTHDGGVVLCDPGQQRLQPPVEAFTCQRQASHGLPSSIWDTLRHCGAVGV